MKLKQKLLDLQRQINMQISRLEQELNNKHADVKVITTKLSCLESHRRDIEEIIEICDQRNRY